MPAYYFYGSWLWDGVRWIVGQSMGPQLMDLGSAVAAFQAEPYTSSPAPPYAYAGLWQWTGDRWQGMGERSNY